MKIQTGYNALKITDEEFECKKCKKRFFLIRGIIGKHRETIPFLQTIINFGKEHTDVETAEILKSKYGNKKFCNAMYVKRTIDKIGPILEEFHKEEHKKKQENFIKAEGAKVLICLMDGTFVHKWQEKRKNFEVIGIKVFNPENVVEISKDRKIILKNHSSGVLGTNNNFLIKELMRCLLSEGWNYKTKVFFCADGEEKLWTEGKEKIINSEGILDWFHISKKLTEIFLWQSDELKIIWKKLKDLLWEGKTDNAINEIDKIKIFDSSKIQKKVNNFIGYLENNRSYIVNYDENRKNGLPISSAPAESLIEQLISPRLKKKQKMQWSRITAEYILQIRSCYINKEENLFWDYYFENVA